MADLVISAQIDVDGYDTNDSVSARLEERSLVLREHEATTTRNGATSFSSAPFQWVTSPLSRLGSLVQRPGTSTDALPSRGKGRFGLFPLINKAADATGVVDIIFIHGLNGDYESTWTYGEGENAVNWPNSSYQHKSQTPEFYLMDIILSCNLARAPQILKPLLVVS
jgi:hypothetical protein